MGSHGRHKQRNAARKAARKAERDDIAAKQVMRRLEELAREDAPGLDRIRLPNGQVLRVSDWVSEPMYSTIDLDPATLQPVTPVSYGSRSTRDAALLPRKRSIRPGGVRGKR